MNTIESIKMLTILNEELKSIDFDEKKGREVSQERREAILLLIPSIKKQVLDNIKHSKVAETISNEYDRFVGQNFNNVTTEELVKLNQIDTNKYENVSKFLNLEDPYYHLICKIKEYIKKNHRLFTLDESTVDIYFSTDGEILEFNASSQPFCNETDYISEIFLSLDDILKEG